MELGSRGAIERAPVGNSLPKATRAPALPGIPSCFSLKYDHHGLAARDVIVNTAIIQDMGIEYLTAEDGQQAIDVAKKSRPDLILMDIALPKVSGLDATR
ncbi:MAG: response regulator [Proteobacteria bacterium]|nr:response regulator [Pseudomonadota bacterium]